MKMFEIGKTYQNRDVPASLFDENGILI